MALSNSLLTREKESQKRATPIILQGKIILCLNSFMDTKHEALKLWSIKLQKVPDDS